MLQIVVPQNCSARQFSLNDREKTMFEQGLAQMKQYNESLPDRTTSLTLMLDPSDQSAAIVRNVVTSIANAFNYQLIGAEN